MSQHLPFRAVILDRDGVINHDSDNYIKHPDEWQPIAGSLEAISRLNKFGLKVGIATNQSGIGRQYYSESTLLDMHKKMANLLANTDGHIDAIRFCPHHPNDGCECRKPKPQMLESLAREFDIPLSKILFVGDSKSDYECAKNAGCSFALVLTGKGKKTQQTLNQLGFQCPLSFVDLTQLVSELFGRAV